MAAAALLILVVVFWMPDAELRRTRATGVFKVPEEKREEATAAASHPNRNALTNHGIVCTIVRSSSPDKESPCFANQPPA